MKPKALEQQLGQFQPSSNRHEHPSGLLYTDGIAYIIENLALSQLVLEIARRQKEEIARDQSLRNWQYWEFTKREISLYNHSLPLDGLEIFVIDGCLMLPSEYLG